MLTRGDDYPIHQTPEPVAVAGTDRNFYDRYFFNGQTADGSLFFAAAMGIYPHLNIIDAAFSVLHAGRQRSVFASRILHSERMDTQVAPIAVEVVEPLHQLRLSVGANDSGLSADLLFTGRAPPIEEPRFIRRMGPRTLMDVTRMTQGGIWSGTVTIDGICHGVTGSFGTRDRSWGVRPIGAPDPQPPAPMTLPQFYWLWAPLNFADHLLFFHSNDEGDGSPWNRSALLVPLDGGAPVKLASPAASLRFKPGTRHAASATLEGGGVRVDLTVDSTFFMHGIGYSHPTRAHGTFHGEHSVHTENHACASLDEGILANNHIQALVSATMTLPDGSIRQGRGVLEQLIVGPHAPSGFTGLFDLAP